METFERLESEVRSYCRTFKTVFAKAAGSQLIDEDGNSYIDFFAGAGALNYGHNHPMLQEKLVEYITSGGITHALDMMTSVKREFLQRFEEIILKPRNMNYKVMFTGPTGTNAVEAALKLARKVTGRTNIVSFTNGFHGMTLGSLAVTGNASKRNGAGIPLHNVTFMPYDGFGKGNSLDLLRSFLENSSSGLDKPAAFIFESVQGEGGINVASIAWLQELAEIAKAHDVLLIADDIQAGCGRTGAFFSFERAGIVPDMVTLSKSLSGYGMPFAITLLKPELDIWKPGEHNGTFRGFSPAIVTATEALRFWETNQLAESVIEMGDFTMKHLRKMVDQHQSWTRAEVRGIGLMIGVSFENREIAGRIAARAFEKGLVIETAGPNNEVLKIFPPLVIGQEEMETGLEIIASCMDELSDHMPSLVSLQK